jgi:hypothetical protein
VTVCGERFPSDLPLQGLRVFVAYQHLIIGDIFTVQKGSTFCIVDPATLKVVIVTGSPQVPWIPCPHAVHEGLRVIKGGGTDTVAEQGL